MNDSFYCECCGNTFPKGRPDEEAVKEKNYLFANENIEDMPLVCDDCFKKIMVFNNDHRFLKKN